jgi:hypothetical protein
MSFRSCPTEKPSTLYQRFSDSAMEHSLSCSDMGLVDMSTQFAGWVVLPSNNRYKMEGKGRRWKKRTSGNWKMVKKKFLFKESISRLYQLSCFCRCVSSLLASICLNKQHFNAKKRQLPFSGHDVLMVVNFEMRMFWNASPCVPVHLCQHFGQKNFTNVLVRKNIT